MLLAPRYHELDLPIYEAGSTLTDASKLVKDTETLTGDTFLRTVNADFYAGTGSQTDIDLKELLDITDEELKRAADLCHAEVVGHQWGLLEQPDGKRPYTRNVSVPEGYLLVAEVDILKDAVQLDLLTLPKALSISTMGTLAVGFGMARYNHNLFRRGHRLMDMRPSQFVFGSCPKQEDSTIRSWLVDIEPRVQYI